LHSIAGGGTPFKKKRPKKPLEPDLAAEKRKMTQKEGETLFQADKLVKPPIISRREGEERLGRRRTTL